MMMLKRLVLRFEPTEVKNCNAWFFNNVNKNLIFLVTLIEILIDDLDKSLYKFYSVFQVGLRHSTLCSSFWKFPRFMKFSKVSNTKFLLHISVQV